MSEQTPASAPLADNQHKNIVLITYGLYVLGIFLGLPALIGLIIAYVKRKDAEGSVYHSHFTYLIRTFWIALLGCFLGALLLFVVVGAFVLILVGIWFIIRVIYGFVKANDQKAINPTTWFLN
ncbi:hypothetical protein A4G20_04785 [Pasteurellaceae bacterium RH1A]|nr:hypothetical protein A4G20_04785 [Pasteurellaceae bacterium RH1A]